MPKLPDERPDALLQNVIAEHDTHRPAISEVLRQPERRRDPTLAFLISVVEAVEPELRSIAKQF